MQEPEASSAHPGMRRALVLVPHARRPAFVDGVCAWMTRHAGRGWCLEDATATPVGSWAERIRRRRPAGVLVSCPSLKRWAMLPLHDLPCVRVLENCVADVPEVSCDERAVAALALGHLRSLGLRRFAVTGYARHPGAERCLQAFVAACRGAACAIAPSIGGAQAMSALAAWLATLTSPIGIFSVSSRGAEAVIDAARSLDRAVPRDIAVIACGDSRLCVSRVPAISCVDLDDHAQGMAAMDLLDRISMGKPHARRVVVPPRGVQMRASSDPAISASLPTKAALQAIREREGRLSVVEAAASSGVSARRLQQLFRAELGSSPRAVICTERLRRAQRLLSTGRLRLRAIAHDCGFDSAEAFGRAFRRVIGEPPMRWCSRRRS